MKKLLLIYMMVVSSVIAEEGFERGIDKDQARACQMAKEKAYSRYGIFRMNSGCFCEKTAEEEWKCDIYFNYIQKK